jgi:carbon-monoxide dehydrogenase medium subunit
MRLSQPTALVDLGGLPDLAYIREADGIVEIGAMTRTRDVETSPVISSAVLLLPGRPAVLGARMRRHARTTTRRAGTSTR